MVMEKKKRNPWVMRTVGIAAAVAVCVMGGLGIHLYGSRFAVESTVSLDVNPSIEIQVNAKEHVLKVEPKNEDGRKVVGGLFRQFPGRDRQRPDRLHAAKRLSQ